MLHFWRNVSTDAASKIRSFEFKRDQKRGGEIKGLNACACVGDVI